jgi:hypothetical protein
MMFSEISNSEADFFVKQTSYITIIPSFEEEILHFVSVKKEKNETTRETPPRV